MPSKLLTTLMKTAVSASGILVLGLSSCQTISNKKPAGELQPISRHVDLKRFMGDWYVIGNIPVCIEKNAYNAMESYQLAEDGTIPTSFTFNEGGFDGPLKSYHPKGFIHNKETNAEWRMQFVWPFKANYRITYLSDDYQTTIIGVPDRKYAWIMARTKTLPDATYRKLVAELKRQGYDLSKLRKVPQR
jgi:apolipoprotein D and lipocalin family protein